MPKIRLEDLTVAELKERLRAKGLPVGGRKSELIARLRGNAKRNAKCNAKRNAPRNPESGASRVPTDVLDRTLYIKVRNDVKKRVKVWPSAYASGQVTREYKKAGGRYAAKREPTRRTPTRRAAPRGPEKRLTRWYKEKWVNVCDTRAASRTTPRTTSRTTSRAASRTYPPCGRERSTRSKESYPYCRPSVRVNKNTPMTVGELKSKYKTEAEANAALKRLCKKKRRDALPKAGRAQRITPKETRRHRKPK